MSLRGHSGRGRCLSPLAFLLRLCLGSGQLHLRFRQPSEVSCPLGTLGELGHSTGGPQRAGLLLSTPWNFSSRLRWDRCPLRSTQRHDVQAAQLRPVLLLSQSLGLHPPEERPAPQQLPRLRRPLRRQPPGAHAPRRGPPPHLLQRVGCCLGAGLCHPPHVGWDTQLLNHSPRGVRGLVLRGSPRGRGAGGLCILLPRLWGGQ